LPDLLGEWLNLSLLIDSLMLVIVDFLFQFKVFSAMQGCIVFSLSLHVGIVIIQRSRLNGTQTWLGFDREIRALVLLMHGFNWILYIFFGGKIEDSEITNLFVLLRFLWKWKKILTLAKTKVQVILRALVFFPGWVQV
jgi:hypothetical protein